MSSTTKPPPHTREPPRGRAIYLLAILLLLFVIVPALHALRSAGAPVDEERGLLHGSVLGIGVLAALLVAAITVAQTSRPLVVVLLLAGLPTIARVAEAFGWDAPMPVRAAAGVYVGVALLYVVGRGLQRLFTRREVNTDTIATAICAYILIGLAWVYLYSAAEMMVPDAFTRPRQDGGEVFYFSFVTLTTLGYGDIIPRAPITRSLAVVEAIIGQMYVAIVLARLVGMYYTDRGTQER